MGEMPRHRRLFLAGLLILFLGLATLYNAVSTPFEAPDEIGHFYYVVHLLRDGRLPVVPADQPEPHFEQEGVQPPLYYASAALVVRGLTPLLGLDLEDAGAPLDVNPHSVCARPGARYNVTYLAHDPHVEQFPYRGRVRVLHVVRLWSSLLGVATVAGVFVVARLAFPDTLAAAWLAAGLVAFTPEFLFTAGAASNDNLVTALATWGVYLALRLVRDGLRWPHTLALGVVAGLATLSKLSGALLLPLAIATIPLAAILRAYPKMPAIRPPRSLPRDHTRQMATKAPISPQSSSPTRPRRSGARFFRHLLSHSPSAIHHSPFPLGHLSFVICHWLLVALPFLSLTLWWFLRNWTLYGDLTGTRPMLDLLPLRHEVSVWTLIREIPGTFHSWWAAFGCTAPPDWLYLFPLALVLGGLAGLVVDRRRLRRYWPQVGVLLAWLALMVAAYVRWNWVIHAAKGRLLYPAMAGVAVLLGRGWAAWGERWRPVSLVVLVLAGLGAAAVPLAVMAPPVSPPAVTAAVADVRPEHPLDGRFGAEIALLGYDLDGDSFEAGEWLDLTLYWQALVRPPVHYTLAIQLASAVPGETDTLVNFNTWTGGGNYPTGNWHLGDVIADRYRLRLPDDVSRAQSWHLQVILFDLDGGLRLPFTLDGQPASKAAVLAQVRVGAAQPDEQAPPEPDRLAAPVDFGQVVALDGTRVTQEGEELGLTLWWRDVAPVAGDYVVFVHLYDGEGQLVATADGPPLAGGFPTSLWRPGDRVADERVLSLPEGGSAPFRLGVGWYDRVTGVRLAAMATDGARLPGDEVLIPVSP